MSENAYTTIIFQGAGRDVSQNTLAHQGLTAAHNSDLQVQAALPCRETGSVSVLLKGTPDETQLQKTFAPLGGSVASTPATQETSIGAARVFTVTPGAAPN